MLGARCACAWRGINMRLFVAAILAIAMLSTPVLAQGVDVTNEAMVEVKTIDASGQEKIEYVTAEKVVPGWSFFT